MPTTLKAQKVRTLIARDFEEAYRKVDVILTPTTPGSGFRCRRSVGRSRADVLERHFHGDGEQWRGVPGISVPAGLSSEGTPLSASSWSA